MNGKIIYEIEKSISQKSLTEPLSQEIDRCKKSIEYHFNNKRNYKRMNIILGIFTGSILLTTYPNFYHLMNVLKVEPSGFTMFTNISQMNWALKPLFGYISDSFHPFFYRTKIYLFLASGMMFLSCALVSAFQHNLFLFTTLYSLINCFVGFVDAQAEGLTAVITKMDSRLAELLEQLGETAEINSSESIGNYFVYRNLSRIFLIFLGGVFSQFEVGIVIVYYILAIAPFLLAAYTFLVFKEIKVNFFQRERRNLDGLSSAYLGLQRIL